MLEQIGRKQKREVKEASLCDTKIESTLSAKWQMLSCPWTRSLNRAGEKKKRRGKKTLDGVAVTL